MTRAMLKGLLQALELLSLVTAWHVWRLQAGMADGAARQLPRQYGQLEVAAGWSADHPPCRLRA